MTDKERANFYELRAEARIRDVDLLRGVLAGLMRQVAQPDPGMWIHPSFQAALKAASDAWHETDRPTF